MLDLADSDQYFHEEPAPTSPAADLISEPAISSMRESLAALAMMSQPSSRPQIVRSGETSVHDLNGLTLGSFTLTDPFDAALVDDRRVMHGVTAVEPVDPADVGYRDVLVVTFRREGE